MKKRLLTLILTVARFCGLFAISRSLTASHLRVLCYHGIALQDESGFRPGLFMTASTFERRMQLLDKWGYPVIPLGKALEDLDNGTLPKCATVLTIDDGWFGTYKFQFPILRKYGFPATLYVSSYYLINQNQVFNVAVSYVLWKSGIRSFDMSLLELSFSQAANKETKLDVDDIQPRITDIAESMNGAMARQLLFRKFCDAIGFDWREIEAGRLISFMSKDEARKSVDYGVDIQLHTHRHCFPDTNFESARKEIEDNRRVLQEITRAKLQHFCYPSGVYSNTSIDNLKNLGIKSATTTDPGFNRKRTPRLKLTRFLDSELISDLEFEAEMSGFFELIRMTGYRI